MNLPVLDNPPKAIALDLDGTLLDSQTRLSERNRRSMEGCLERGIPIIIATSRPARIFNRVFPQDLAGRCSLAIMNGAIALGNPPLSGYFKETLPEETARNIIELAKKFNPDVRITLELDGYEFGTNRTTDPATLWERNSATPDMVLPIEVAISKQPCKIALGSIGMDILVLADILKNSHDKAISVIPALLGNPLLNITSSQASKPNALRKLLSPKGIPLEEVIAFGDDHPDIGMLKECGISVAVANAFPEVKSACAYHTASNDDDGVAIVLEEMLKSL